MAETDGYWGKGYYAGGYWGEGYWGVYSTEPSPVATSVITGGVAVKKRVFPLELGITLNGELVWVIPVKMQKENV